MDVALRIDELVEGMYVSDLDRPWTDTPFMLQGFVYDHVKHVWILREYCKQVYVCIERSVDPGATVLARRFGPKPPKPLTRWERFIRWLRKVLGLGPKRRVPTLSSQAFLIQYGVENDATVDWRAYAQAAIAARRMGWLSRWLMRQTGGSQRPAAVFAQGGFITSSVSTDPQPLTRARTLQSQPPMLISIILRILDFVLPMLSVDIERRMLDRDALVAPQYGMLTVQQRFQQTKATLKKTRVAYDSVIQDIRRERKLVIGSVNEVINGLVDVAAEHPHILLWLNKLKGVTATSYEHAIDVSIYMVCLGRHLGYQREELQLLGLVGFLQDIGYISLPEDLLSTPGPLSPQQYGIVQSHVEKTLSLLRETPEIPAKLLEVISQHHERHDGSGYPLQLKSDQIDPLAQIAGLADTFHAMTSDRPFRKAMTTNETLQNLYKWKGTSFNEGLVEQFIQCIGVYPVGTIVELSTGEIGIVIAQNRIRRLKPRVMVLFNEERVLYSEPWILDLINDPLDVHDLPYAIRRDLPPGAHGIKPEEYFL